MKNFSIIAKTLAGLEETIASELRELGAANIEVLNRAVKYQGDQAMLYKSNLLLRTAIKILKPIATFEVKNENQLYGSIRSIKWDDYITVDQTIAIDGTTTGDLFTHSQYVALKSKDAIVDQFREKYGRRPSVDTVNPDLQLNVHISVDRCTVSLDSSGESLNKRGYRLEQTLAPISEVLAAGIILLSGWDKKSDFIDPMCGSGTFPIEAALIANNIAPGRLRNFCFEKWKDFDSMLWQKIKRDAAAKTITFSGKIRGQDIDRAAIPISSQNAQRAGVANNIHFEKMNFLESKLTSDNGVVIMNPPYGERMQKEEIEGFYREIGSKLKHFYMGCDAWIISANLEAMKRIGLKASKKITLFNGPLECRLNKYELYKGSRENDAPPSL